MKSFGVRALLVSASLFGLAQAAQAQEPVAAPDPAPAAEEAPEASGDIIVRDIEGETVRLSARGSWSRPSAFRSTRSRSS